MLLDDVFKENGVLMTQEVEPVKKELKEVSVSSYLKEVNLDNAGELAKKAVKTDFGYTMVLATLGGVGLSIYFHTFEPLVYSTVSGVVFDVTLRIAEKLNFIKFE